MQLSEQSAFSELLMGLGLMYGKPLHGSVMDIWWQALKQREFAAVKKALETHVIHPDKGQFMPKPADVIAQLEGTHESQALRAWTLVFKSLKGIGSYESVIFPDRRIHAVIQDMGGWVFLCKTESEELPFRAKEFEKRYEAFLIHPPLECPPLLTGIVEQQNRLKGWAIPEPIDVAQLFPTTLTDHQPQLEVL